MGSGCCGPENRDDVKINRPQDEQTDDGVLQNPRFSVDEKDKAKLANPRSTCWLFGNPDNPIIIQIDLRTVTRNTCRKIETPAKNFKLRFNTAYVRISENEILTVGGSTAENGPPTKEV